jgi:hypothetical protein
MGPAKYHLLLTVVPVDSHRSVYVRLERDVPIEKHLDRESILPPVAGTAVVY